MSRWFRLSLDGRVTELPEGKLTLEQMQQEVGGYIERLQLDGRTCIWANEEGLLLGLDVNVLATHIAQRVHGPSVGIVGPALVEFSGKPTKIGQPILDNLVKCQEGP